jgi:RNA polymerase-binding protein DksA
MRVHGVVRRVILDGRAPERRRVDLVASSHPERSVLPPRPSPTILETEEGFDMSAPMHLERRLTASMPLTDHQVELLRDQLSDALAEHRRQLQQNDALFDAISGATGDDEFGHDREFARVVSDRAREAIDEIEAALVRLNDGTYGACETCGRSIPFERLEAIPDARHCVACPAPTRTGP